MGAVKMTRKLQPTSKAIQFLHDRYIGNDPERLASLEGEWVNAEIARQLYDLRTAAGLTQRQLAQRVGTTASVICQLEDAEYEGHSLTMLRRIARAFGKRVEIRFVTENQSRPPAKKSTNEELRSDLQSGDQADQGGVKRSNKPGRRAERKNLKSP